MLLTPILSNPHLHTRLGISVNVYVLSLNLPNKKNKHTVDIVAAVGVDPAPDTMEATAPP